MTCKDVATAAVAVNALPRVIKAAPGLLTMMDLPPVRRIRDRGDLIWVRGRAAAVSRQ
jgi:hypothetical protein